MSVTYTEAQRRANFKYYHSHKNRIHKHLKEYYDQHKEVVKHKRRLRYAKQKREKILNKFIEIHLQKLCSKDKTNTLYQQVTLVQK